MASAPTNLETSDFPQIPASNGLAQIILLVEWITEQSKPSKLTDWSEAKARQTEYYAQAAERALGLLQESGQKWVASKAGRELAKIGESGKNNSDEEILKFLASQLLVSPLFSYLAEWVSEKSPSPEELRAEIISLYPGSEETGARRVPAVRGLLEDTKIVTKGSKTYSAGPNHGVQPSQHKRPKDNKTQTDAAESWLRDKIAEVAEEDNVSPETALSALYISFIGLTKTAKDAIEYVVDGSGDEGIDFIYIDPVLRQIHIGQTAHNQMAQSSPSKEKVSFHLNESIDIINNADVKKLDKKRASLFKAARKGLDDGYETILHFVTTGRFAPDSKTKIDNFINNDSESRLEAVELDDLKDLFAKFHGYANSWVNSGKVKLVDNHYHVEEGPQGKALVTSLKGQDLKAWAEEHGDLLFAQNIRFFKGEKTQPNKDMITVLQSDERSNFWAYNNGITIVTKRLNINEEDNEVTLEKFSIINGCQTTMTLGKRDDDELTDVKVLARIIEVSESNDEFLTDVVKFNNNQNKLDRAAFLAKDETHEEISEILRRLPRPWFYELRVGEYKRMDKEKQELYDNKLGDARVIKAPLDVQALATMQGQWDIGFVHKNRIVKETEKIFQSTTREEDAARLIWAHEMQVIISEARKDIRDGKWTKKATKPERRKSILNQRMAITLMSIPTMRMMLEEKGYNMSEIPKDLGNSGYRDTLRPYAEEAIRITVTNVEREMNRIKEDEVLKFFRKSDAWESVESTINDDVNTKIHE